MDLYQCLRLFVIKVNTSPDANLSEVPFQSSTQAQKQSTKQRHPFRILVALQGNILVKESIALFKTMFDLSMLLF